MARLSPTIPAENDVLCEGCGYTLNGLPEHSRCPECGKPIVESIGSLRRLPAWETSQTPANFWRTTVQVLFRPTSFYQTLATRRQVQPAQDFARLHWLAVALLFAIAAAGHVQWYLMFSSVTLIVSSIGPLVLLTASLAVLTYLTLWGLTFLAAWLTNWEASYRGIRLPLNVVLRGMYYHAAHYLPVSLLAAVTVLGYQWLLSRDVLSYVSATQYLYVLCAEVVACALYLFKTYWIGMRNMMYANR